MCINKKKKKEKLHYKLTFYLQFCPIFFIHEIFRLRCIQLPENLAEHTLVPDFAVL